MCVYVYIYYRGLLLLTNNTTICLHFNCCRSMRKCILISSKRFSTLLAQTYKIHGDQWQPTIKDYYLLRTRFIHSKIDRQRSLSHCRPKVVSIKEICKIHTDHRRSPVFCTWMTIFKLFESIELNFDCIIMRLFDALFIYIFQVVRTQFYWECSLDFVPDECIYIYRTHIFMF